jgi:prepilin peptidase CpaA
MPLPNVDPVAATIAIAFFILLAAIAAHDMRSLRIPNGLSLALLALYPLHAATAPATAWLPGLGVAGVVFVVGLAAFATGRIGGGDIKLLTVVALWAGPDLILPMLVYTGLIGGAVAMVMISPLRFPIACASAWLRLPAVGDVMLGRQIPYGVAIAGAAALTIGGRLLSAA